MTRAKQHAVRLLRKYDKMRAEMRVLEHELAKACVAYGREIGQGFGFNKDTLRLHLSMEAERLKKEQAA